MFAIGPRDYRFPDGSKPSRTISEVAKSESSSGGNYGAYLRSIMKELPGVLEKYFARTVPENKAHGFIHRSFQEHKLGFPPGGPRRSLSTYMESLDLFALDVVSDMLANDDVTWNQQTRTILTFLKWANPRIPGPSIDFLDLQAAAAAVAVYRRNQGTIVHKYVENLINKSPNVSAEGIGSENVILAARGFAEWIAGKPVLVEYPVGSIEHDLGGTVDILVLRDGRWTVMDLKLSMALFLFFYHLVPEDEWEHIHRGHRITIRDGDFSSEPAVVRALIQMGLYARTAREGRMHTNTTVEIVIISSVMPEFVIVRVDLERVTSKGRTIWTEVERIFTNSKNGSTDNGSGPGD